MPLKVCTLFCASPRTFPEAVGTVSPGVPLSSAIRARASLPLASAFAAKVPRPTPRINVRRSILPPLACMPLLQKQLCRASPQLLAGHARALHQRFEFHPRERGIHRPKAPKRAEAAIRSRDHTLAPNHVGVALDSLRYPARMLHVVGA